MADSNDDNKCNCGSGKPFSECCGKNRGESSAESRYNDYARHLQEKFGYRESPASIEPVGRPNPATEGLKDLQRSLEDRVFTSMEEAQAFVSEWNQEINERPRERFLGLSPEQMYRIIHYPLENNLDLLQLDIKRDDIVPEKVPILKQALFFLHRLEALGQLKATKKGNLPRSFAREIYKEVYELYDSGSKYRTISREDDVPMLSSHRFILTRAGLIKKYRNTFSLTRLGKQMLTAGNHYELYGLLFQFVLEKFDWGSMDHYQNFRIIQDAAIFNLLILKKKAKKFTNARNLGTIFIEAFPDILMEAEESARWGLPDDIVMHCFDLRFLERFCASFGLVEEIKAGLGKRLENQYRITPLFKTLFKWRI